MIGDAALFLGLWLQKPLTIAAICPGRNRPADAVARLGIAGHQVADLWRTLPLAQIWSSTPCTIEDQRGTK